MTLNEIRHGDQVIRGANADLWQIAQEHLQLSRDQLGQLAHALGARDNSVRVASSKQLIQTLWGRHPELGPYPFLDSLSQFEFERRFYPNYRDHVCHQLKVYLLGLGVARGCPRLHDGIAAQLGGDAEIDLAWLVTAVFHDVGYVVEADDAGAGSALWGSVADKYAQTMMAPFHATGWLAGLTPDNEVVLRERLRVTPIGLGYQSGNLAEDQLFEGIRLEAERAGLGAPGGKSNNVIKSYYEYAQKVDGSTRPRFRDHGVASALMLMRHWHNYDAHIDDWVAKLPEADGSVAGYVGRLEELQQLRKQHFTMIQRAAGAMAIHNVTPLLWSEKLKDAASVGLDFGKFSIAIGAGPDTHNALAFLLGLVDTLQDWDRPTFGDEPKPGALHGEDLSIRVDQGLVKVHVAADAAKFVAPANC